MKKNGQDDAVFAPKMEKVQKRSLRFVYNDFTSSYEELLAKGNHSTLYITRLRYMATEFYKFENSVYIHGTDGLTVIIKLLLNNYTYYDKEMLKLFSTPF